MNKYELTDNVIHVNGTVLHRIRALRDIPRYHVKAGDLGGLVEMETNLTQFGDAWVADNAIVFGNAVVRDNAKIYGHACVSGSARVSGNALVSDIALVCGNAWVSGHAEVHCDENVTENIS